MRRKKKDNNNFIDESVYYYNNNNNNNVINNNNNNNSLEKEEMVHRFDQSVAKDRSAFLDTYSDPLSLSANISLQFKTNVLFFYFLSFCFYFIF